MVDSSTILSISGFVLGCILGYFFYKQGFDLIKSALYSLIVSVGISLMIGLLVGGLWSTIFLIVLVILMLIGLPIIYYMSQGKSISEIVEKASEIGIVATGSIPVVAIILLAILGGLFIITGIIVLYYSIMLFIKFGLPLVVGAIASRIVFGLAGI